MEGGEKSIGDEEVLRGSPTLIQDISLLCCMLTVVSVGHSRVYPRFITGLTRLGFAILHSGTTIDNGGKGEKSNNTWMKTQ